MKRLVDLEKLDRLDNLIRRAATGTPEELAKRLGMSRSSLFELITFLKDVMRAPITYIRSRSSYVYEYIPRFYLGFERDRLGIAEMVDTYGAGIDDETPKSKIKVEIEIDDDNFILDDDIDFNELYH